MSWNEMDESVIIIHAYDSQAEGRGFDPRFPLLKIRDLESIILLSPFFSPANSSIQYRVRQFAFILNENHPLKCKYHTDINYPCFNNDIGTDFAHFSVTQNPI